MRQLLLVYFVAIGLFHVLKALGGKLILLFSVEFIQKQVFLLNSQIFFKANLQKKKVIMENRK